MIALPPHAPCGLAGSGSLSAETLAIVCTTARRFVGRTGGGFDVVDGPGCGHVSQVCAGCGQRARWDDGRCGACGATWRA